MKAVIWVLLLVIYEAPANSVDWDGPWNFGMTKVIEKPFDTEAECRTFAVQLIGRMHQGMRAPMRYSCVPMDAELPKGAPR
jgi:hypothetical protein